MMGEINRIIDYSDETEMMLAMADALSAKLILSFGIPEKRIKELVQIADQMAIDLAESGIKQYIELLVIFAAGTGATAYELLHRYQEDKAKAKAEKEEKNAPTLQ